MLQNTPKYHFGSNGGYWVCSCETVRRKFGTPKQCLRVPKRTSFSSFCLHSGSEMLQNTTTHHFGFNGCYWACSCKNVHRNFGTPKQCIWVPKRTSFSLICMKLGSDLLQNTPKHHFVSNAGYLGVFLRKRSSEVRYPETLSSGTETHQFLIVLLALGK